MHAVFFKAIAVEQIHCFILQIETNFIKKIYLTSNEIPWLCKYKLARINAYPVWISTDSREIN